MKNRILLLLLLLTSAGLFVGLTLPDKKESSKPLQLHTIMRLLMLDLHTINEGIYTRNFDLIKQGAMAINNHPPLDPLSRALVQQTLGERMAQFGAFDKIVHNHADSLAFAASYSDMHGVLRHYRIIQQGCVSCHGFFQDEIKLGRIKRIE